MKKDIFSNYDRMKDSMAEVFLQYDQGRMIRKFSLEHDEKYLYIWFLGRNYRINRATGEINGSDDGFATEIKAGYNEVMTIYDVLCCAKDGHLSNQWVNISSLSGIQNGTLESNGNIFQNVGKAFDGRTRALASACEVLQGEKQERGDVAYKLWLFPFLPIILRFWESDEEFPASVQILVDQNTLDYMHYETLMFAVSHMFERIKQNMEAFDRHRADSICNESIPKESETSTERKARP